MDLVNAESGHTCSCGAVAVVCDLDSQDEETDFYCPECFHECKQLGHGSDWDLFELIDGWHVLRAQTEE